MKSVLPVALLSLLLYVNNLRAVELGLPPVGTTKGLGVSSGYQECQYSDYVDSIEGCGAKFIRVGVQWGGIEVGTPGNYDFSGMDAISTSYASRGVRVMWQLVGGSDGMYSPDDPSSPTWRQHFADFTGAVAAHFQGRGGLFEIWNEPEGVWSSWPNFDSPSEYVDTVARCHAAMKAADPNCVILGPTSGANSYSTWLRDCFSGGLLDYVDAVSVHPYQAGKPEDVVATYDWARQQMQTYGGQIKPIASTEWGYSTGHVGPAWQAYVPTPELQADYLQRAFLVNMTQGIPLSLWYNFRNVGTDPDAYEENFGMVKAWPILEEKPAYEAMRKLTSSLAGETFTMRLTDGISSEDWLMVFSKHDGFQTLATWTTGDSHTITVDGWGEVQFRSTPLYINPAPEPSAFLLLSIGMPGALVYA
jgi:polysaccharide biosynthesis protein PslG